MLLQFIRIRNTTRLRIIRAIWKEDMTQPIEEPMHAPESSIEHLATAETLVVSTLRLWVAPHARPHETHPNWKTGLHVAGVAPWGIHAFDTLLWITVAAGKRELDVRCEHCPCLGRDEAWMLQMVNHVQFELQPEAFGILAGWMPGAATRAAMHHLTLFGHALNNAGMIVELPTGGARLLPAARAVSPPRPRGRGERVTLH